MPGFFSRTPSCWARVNRIDAFPDADRIPWSGATLHGVAEAGRPAIPEQKMRSSYSSRLHCFQNDNPENTVLS